MARPSRTSQAFDLKLKQRVYVCDVRLHRSTVAEAQRVRMGPGPSWEFGSKTREENPRFPGSIMISRRRVANPMPAPPSKQIHEWVGFRNKATASGHGKSQSSAQRTATHRQSPHVKILKYRGAIHYLLPHFVRSPAQLGEDSRITCHFVKLPDVQVWWMYSSVDQYLDTQVELAIR